MRGEGSETRQAMTSLQELKGMLRSGTVQGTGLELRDRGSHRSSSLGPSQSQEGGRTA